MVELSTIARPYAEAAYKVANASSKVQQWSDWLDAWAAVAQNPDIRLLIDNPKLNDEQVLAVFSELSGTPAQAEARNFLSSLVENRRLLALPEIAHHFNGLKNADSGSAEAVITSAFSMDASEVQNMVGPLERKFGLKLNVTVQVDETLIGGITVQVGDQFLDTSVRGKLNAMKVALTA
ncbi:MAG: F0F1 ATP synthase subunit delta [Limnobacter sp.]|nr:F0F1 ATP synthase subunit delta [Limnobacter sp.]